MRFSVAVCSRRTFLNLASSTLFTTMFAVSSGCSLGKTKLEQIAERMIEVLNYPARARLIGLLYIDGLPDVRELTFEQWTKRLLNVLNLDPENISREVLRSLDARLRKQVRQDFVNEDVVIVRGFMFSSTEIMLCSLAATYTQS